jgi:hypothetical protein
MASLQTPSLGTVLVSAGAAGAVGLAHGYAHATYGEADALGAAAVGTAGKFVLGGTFLATLAAQSIMV